MSKSLVSLSFVALATLAGCGGSVCDRINAASGTFYAGKAECKHTSGGSSVTLTRGASCQDSSKCSADDLKVLDTYATCLGQAQACSTGNEEKAVSDGTACAFGAFGGLSDTCKAILK